MRILALCFVLSVGLLAGCSSNPKDQHLETFHGKTAQQLFEGALTNIRGHNYRLAIQKLEAIDARFPFGPYAEQAQLYLIFAYYKNRDSASAIAQADRFIRQHPRHPNVDYAYYMKGKINFTAEVGFFQEAFAAGLDQRDAATARQAFQDFAELLKRFPNSKYANDARKRMIFLRDRLAAYELHVARLYMQRKAYLAAANRAKYVVEHYPQTKAMPDALALLVSAYQLLGLKDEAEHARLTLKFNYPDYSMAE